MVVGGLCGLMAALLQSLSYVASRHFIRRRQTGAAVRLLILSHLCMGVLAIVVFAINWVPHVIWAPAILPVLSSALFCVGGQLGQMQAIKYAEPSRVSPLLSVKLFIPALLATFIGQPVGAAANRSLNGWQWLAVLLCVIAGISIHESGGRMRPRALVAVLYCAAFYAGSDWSIGVAVAGFLHTPHMTVLRASLLTEGSVFIVLAMIAAITFPFIAPGKPRDWRDAQPFALCWFSSMIFLFFAFGQLGVVLGSILQCTRGFMTMLIGVSLMYLGLEHIEPRQPRHVIVRRLAAGFLMFVAIALYIIRDPLTFKLHH